jgi:hypothetical protein
MAPLWPPGGLLPAMPFCHHLIMARPSTAEAGSYKDVRPGCVIALQTFGAYAGNWNPHAHAIVSDGVFTAKGEFLPLPALDATAVLQAFRQLWLRRLHQAERLSEAFTTDRDSRRIAGGKTGFPSSRGGNSPTVPIPLLNPPVSLPPFPLSPCLPSIECPKIILCGLFPYWFWQLES